MARFIAIFAIIALGVGFYGGLLLAKPSFIKTADTFIRDYKMYDFKLMSTIGFDDEDITALADIDGVVSAVGSVTVDALNDENGAVIRIHSLTDEVNQLKVESGRLPQSADEIVLDGYVFDSSVIGTKIILSDDANSEYFRINEFTVVGTVRTPTYIRFQRGSSDIGSGQVKYFACVMPDALDFDYYTEAYLYFDSPYDAFSDEYDEWAENTVAALETELDRIINSRFDDLIHDAYQEIDEAQAEADEELAEAWQELMNAEVEIEEARAELISAGDRLADAGYEIEDGEAALLMSQKELDDALAVIEDEVALLNESQQQLDDGYLQAQAARNELVTRLEEATAAKTELETQLTDVLQNLAALEYAVSNGIPITDSPYTIEELTAIKSQLQDGIASCDEGIEQLQGGIAQIDETIAGLDANQAQIDAGREAISRAREELSRGQQQIIEARQELEDGRREYVEGLEEYENGWQEFFDGQYEYRKGLSEYQEAAAFASRSIGQGRQMIADMESPSTYVLGRDKDAGYVFFESDAQIVAGVARVFPLFFFALAALVCSTTMQRMVTDERNVIGTMRALGYGKFSIIMKYVIYSGSASVLGCVLGYLGGIKLFPFIIWQVYGMMYGFADIVFVNDPLIFLLSLVVSLLCSVGVTVLTADSEMKGFPADLIRPKAPAAGKRILLERITPVWKRLKFTYKVSIRNVFRFKKRMWMMIIGIAGCTALLITGFGIRDSVCDIVDIHYDTIMKYDLSVTVDEAMTDVQMEDLIANADEECGISSVAVFLRSENLIDSSDNTMRDVVLYATDDPNISRVASSISGEQTFDWPGDGQIAISSKLARSRNLRAGDTVTFAYGAENREFTLEIAYVFDNYVFHYAYMNVNTYEEVFGKSFDPNTILVRLPEGADPYSYGMVVSSDKNVKTWSATSAMREGFHDTMTQMNSIVVLVIACAAALAFIVLFNLNNINITERVREIATLKVLGFKRGETGSYVFRENFILIFMGFIVGIPAGIELNKFVIGQIEMDTVTFVVQIYPISYVYALALVILFSLIVDAVMRLKIEKINMAESLKSIE